MEQEQFSELKSKLDTLKDRITSQYEAQSARVTPPLRNGMRSRLKII